MKTVGIFGNVHGGTSAVAGVVRILGIAMFGDNWRSDEPTPLTDEIIQERYGSYSSWGFKHPSLLWQASSLQTALRNPHYVFVSRDPVASLCPAGKQFEPNQITEARRQYELLFNQIALTTVPYIVISYERLLYDSEKIVSQIASFLGLNTSKKAVDFLQHTEGYKDVTNYI